MMNASNTPLLDALPGDARLLLDQYEEMLRRESLLLNLTRITGPEAVKLRHFEDALSALAVLDKHLPENAHIVDVGSGAGVPGLVLAAARPEWRMVSVEATSKKADFQARVAEKLMLGNVEVLDERSEALGRDAMWRETFDAALARALAPLPELAELCLPLVKPDGILLCWKSMGIDEELDAGEKACSVMGAHLERAHTYTLGAPTSDKAMQFQLLEIHKDGPTPDRYPRRYNAIRKRPAGAT